MGSKTEKRWVICSRHPKTNEWERWSNETYKTIDDAIDDYEYYSDEYYANNKKGLVNIVPCTVTTSWQEPGGGE